MAGLVELGVLSDLLSMRAVRTRCSSGDQSDWRDPLGAPGSHARTCNMLLRPHEYAALLDRYDTWLFDCDGVIWLGDHIIEGVIAVLGLLREHSASQFNPTVSIRITACDREEDHLRH